MSESCQTWQCADDSPHWWQTKSLQQLRENVTSYSGWDVYRTLRIVYLAYYYDALEPFFIVFLKKKTNCDVVTREQNSFSPASLGWRTFPGWCLCIHAEYYPRTIQHVPGLLRVPNTQHKKWSNTCRGVIEGNSLSSLNPSSALWDFCDSPTLFIINTIFKQVCLWVHIAPEP